MSAANTGATFVERLRNPVTQRLVYFGIVPLLLLLALLFPPVGLLDRVRYRDYTPIDQRGGQIQAGGITLQIPAGAVHDPTYLRISNSANPPSTSPEHLPAGYTQVGATTEIQTAGPTTASPVINVSLANVSEPVNQLDVFAWDGTQWEFLPTRAENNQLVAESTTLPQSLILLHSAQGTILVSSDLDPGQNLPAGSEQRVARVFVNNLVLGGEDGTVKAGATGPQDSLLSSTNMVNGIIRSDWLNNILAKDDWRNNHSKALVAEVTNKNAPGLALDYRQINPPLRQQFTVFVQDLANALHTQGKSLALILPPPEPGNDGRLDTGAYDWDRLGASADQIVLRTPDSPVSFAPGGAVETMLDYAVRQIDRRKLALMLRVGGQDISGAPASEKVLSKSFQEALAPILNVTVKTQSELVAGKSVELDLPGFGSTTLQYDPAAQSHFFTYTDAEKQKHTVWLEDAASLGSHLALSSDYHLAGVFISGLLDSGSDPRAGDVVQAFLSAAQPPALPNRMAIRWTIVDDQGKPVLQATRGPEAAAFSWQANQPGNYLVRADLSTDGGLTISNHGQALKLNVVAPTNTPTPTPSPTPLPTNTPTPTPTSSPTSTPKPTNTPAPTALASSGGQTQGSAAAPTPAAPAAPVAAAPPPRILGGGVDYGVQADMITDGNHGRILGAIQQMGFHWVKQQVEWKRYEPAKGQYDFGALDNLVSSANGAGVRVMFSVVKAPRWARPGDSDFGVEGPPANPQDYGDFMSALASHFKGRVGAYEIWNEQNLWYEWGGQGGRISPSGYIELLKRAYVAVKNADPNAVVISGALTPTGVNDGSIAMDDRAYLEQMYRLGLANFCDAVGAHPSGFNNPPDADWQSWSDPSAPSFKGHPSFFFRGTMEGYRNIMAVYGDSRKKIWVTEFGWATVDHLGVGPASGYEYAATNNEQKQAEWLVRAFQLAQNWGWVGTMFVWNLNFAPVSGPADEKAAFGLVRADWSHRPAFDALANMAK